MSLYERAKVELERVLLEPRAPKQLSLVDDAQHDERALVVTAKSEPLVVETDRHAAITVMQPYAWLLAHAHEWPCDVLGKTVENRSRPTNHRGPVLIHVSRRWERVDERLTALRKLGLVGGTCPEPTREQMQAQLGKVIAVAQLTGCRRVGDRDPHPWAIAGSWAWELAEVELVVPFDLRGNTGLWYAPNLALRKLASQTYELALRPGDERVQVGSLLAASFKLHGVRQFEHVVELDGEPITAGELMALAAEEMGDFDFARNVRARMQARRAEKARRHG